MQPPVCTPRVGNAPLPPNRAAGNNRRRSTSKDAPPVALSPTQRRAVPRHSSRALPLPRDVPVHEVVHKRRPVSRLATGGLEIPATTPAAAQPGRVSRGRAPHALASAMPPLTQLPPLSPPSQPRLRRLAGGYGNYCGGEDAVTDHT